MTIEIHDGLFAHPSGCLWRPEGGVLFAADLHLGYAWAQRRRGELAPPVAGDAAALVLDAVRELEPREVVLLGDIVHAPDPVPEEWALIEAALGALAGAVPELTLVAGNHDRGFSRPCVPEWRSGDLLAVHGDRLPSAPEREQCFCLYGHWHPAILLHDDAGASHRLKAFVATGRAAVLPALTSFSAGLNLRRPWPDDLREALGPGPARAWVAAGRRLKGPLVLGAR